MKKSEVLDILTSTELTRAMRKRYVSQITRLQENIPQKYHRAILKACEAKMEQERRSIAYRESTLKRLMGG